MPAGYYKEIHMFEVDQSECYRNQKTVEYSGKDLYMSKWLKELRKDTYLQSQPREAEQESHDFWCYSVSSSPSQTSQKNIKTTLTQQTNNSKS